jgi:CRP-like cAMP-binding protein
MIGTPVTKVELRRATLAEICRADEQLRRCELFQALSRQECERLIGASVALRFPDRAPVYRQGDGGQSMFLVLRGEVRLVSEGGGAGAQSVEFAVARKGDTFGEAELVGASTVRSCSALAVGEVDVMELPPAPLMEVGRANARLVSLVQEVHGRRRAASQELTAFLSRW